MGRRELLLLLLPFVLVSCATSPRMSAWRQALREDGVEKEVEVGGITTHYLDKGEGPVVVLLHGLGGSAYDWRSNVDALAEGGFRVVAPDRKGAGYTDKPVPSDYSFPAHSERVIRLLDHLGVEKADFVGNSYGGGVVLMTAFLHPERVDRLVLIDAACYPQEFPLHVKVLQFPVVAPVLFSATPKRISVFHFLRQSFGDPSGVRDEDVLEYAHELAFRGTRDALISTARQIHPKDADLLIRRIPEIRRPCLILWGEEDSIIPVAHAHRLHEEIEGSRLILFPRCGHMPNQEIPEKVNAAILEFLREGRGLNGAEGD